MLNWSQIFQDAHWLARRTLRGITGFSYSATFGLCLKKAIADAKAAIRQPVKAAKRGRIIVPHVALVLNVPFAEKNFAKSHGAKWHPIQKTWYYENGKNLPKALEKYL
jgi:hypothetical protein